MERQQSQPAATVLLQAVQPEVQKYLEAVYAVAPVPEEYVKYRLHLATALPLELLDAWFELRRQSPPGYLDGILTSKPSHGSQMGGGPQAQGSHVIDRRSGPGFSLFGPPGQSSKDPQMAVPLRVSGKGEDRSARKILSPADIDEPRIHNLEPRDRVVLSRQPAAGDDSGSGEESSANSTRFTEADLQSISYLVGLETLTSTQEHCGSTSLFMFEQLTALDSLDTEGKGNNKRKRTRHQHFWRNTDKLDARERVYIPTNSIKPALRKNQPVVPKSDISPEERTNAWTVCLTTRGVVSYLNKRISPLGVQLIRALQKSSRQSRPPQTTDPISRPVVLSTQGSNHGGRELTRSAEEPVSNAPARDSAWTRVREEPENQRSRPRSTSLEATDSETSGSQGIGQKRKSDWQPALLPTLSAQLPDQSAQHPPAEEEKSFELIPRARRRKPA